MGTTTGKLLVDAASRHQSRERITSGYEEKTICGTPPSPDPVPDLEFYALTKDGRYTGATL